MKQPYTPNNNVLSIYFLEEIIGRHNILYLYNYIFIYLQILTIIYNTIHQYTIHECISFKHVLLHNHLRDRHCGRVELHLEEKKYNIQAVHWQDTFRNVSNKV